MALFEFVATICCAPFAGAAVYINFVEHPARMECGTELAATVFPVSYRKATVMQVLLAVSGLVSAVAAWAAGSAVWWLIGGLLLGSVIPFTLLVVIPTNNELVNPALDKGSESTRRLLSRWGRLHAVRSILSVFALIIFLVHA
jgi:uncharacterized membrane protein